MSKIKGIVITAMFIAIGMVLPFLTGQIPQFGSMLLPMHIPVLLCGLICGWQCGLVCGLILPVLRSMIFTMPPMFPTAVAMSFELATYGGVIGFLYDRSKWKCLVSLYRSLIVAMLVGRAVWGVVMAIISGISQSGFTFGAFMAGGFLNAVPGIILQLILIPSVMVLLKRTKMITLSVHEKKYDKNDK